MRISDWSSDVCSSDLRRTMSPCPPDRLNAARALSRISVSPVTSGRGGSLTHGLAAAAVKGPASSAALTATRRKAIAARSEEHTSELQELMRITYAVFCLKKKQYQHIDTLQNTQTP